MSLTIVDIELLRERGAISGATGEGAPSAKQLESALGMAREQMIEVVGINAYVTVKGFTDDDLVDDEDDTDEETVTKETNRNKRAAFENAECYYAIAALPQVLNAQQLSHSGFFTKVKVNDSESTHASMEEGRRVGQAWEQRAKRALAPYLAKPTTGVGKKGGGFFFMDI